MVVYVDFKFQQYLFILLQCCPGFRCDVASSPFDISTCVRDATSD